MTKKIMTLMTAAAIAVGFAGAAYAADHTQPGVPGTPNCKGQTTAYLAQAAKNGVEEVDAAFHGIGGVGHFLEVPVEIVQQEINLYCEGEVGL